MTNSESAQTFTRFRRANHVAWRRIGGETVVLDLKAHRAFGLNEPGGAVWEAIVDLPDGAAEAIAPSEPAVQAFLAELAGLGLVEAAPEGTHASVSTPTLALAGSPKVAWSDEIRSFGAGTCGFVPGGGETCRANPHG